MKTPTGKEACEYVTSQMEMYGHENVTAKETARWEDDDQVSVLVRYDAMNGGRDHATWVVWFEDSGRIYGEW